MKKKDYILSRHVTYGYYHTESRCFLSVINTRHQLKEVFRAIELNLLFRFGSYFAGL